MKNVLLHYEIGVARSPKASGVKSINSRGRSVIDVLNMSGL